MRYFDDLSYPLNPFFTLGKLYSVDHGGYFLDNRGNRCTATVWEDDRGYQVDL